MGGPTAAAAMAVFREDDPVLGDQWAEPRSAAGSQIVSTTSELELFCHNAAGMTVSEKGRIPAAVMRASETRKAAE